MWPQLDSQATSTHHKSHNRICTAEDFHVEELSECKNHLLLMTSAQPQIAAAIPSWWFYRETIQRFPLFSCFVKAKEKQAERRHQFVDYK